MALFRSSAVTLLFALTCAASHARGGVVTWQPGSLPSEQGWTFAGNLPESASETSIFSLKNDGSLHQNTMPLDAGGGYHARYECWSSELAGDSFTINFKIKVTQSLSGDYPNGWINPGGFLVFLAGAGGAAHVGLTTEEVVLQTENNDVFGGGDTRVPIGNTVYHDFTVTGSLAVGGSYSLYCDGEFRATTPLWADYATSRNWMVFGDSTEGAATEAYLMALTVTMVPEPASLVLLGLAGAVMLRRHRR